MASNKLKKKANEIIKILEEIYPEAKCALMYNKEKPYELLFATRLSAQCTDKRVNEVTPLLFEKYRTLESIASADLSELEEIIKPCGLFKTKAKSIKTAANQLIDDFGGKLPSTLDELTTLSGIGRKTANLIMGDIYGKPAVVTDTHCIRICERLGLTSGKEPEKVERQLREILPPEKSNDFCHRIVMFGREVCMARKPKCDECRLRDLCEHETKDKNKK